MDILILELVSNQSNVPVKINGMQQHEETRSLLRIGDQLRASAGFLVPCFHGTLAKLSGVVPNVILELRSIQLPVKIDGMQQHEETRSLLRIGDQLFNKDKRTI